MYQAQSSVSQAPSSDPSSQVSSTPEEPVGPAIDWVHLARLVAHFDSLDTTWTGDVSFEEFIARLTSQNETRSRGSQSVFRPPSPAGTGRGFFPRPGQLPGGLPFPSGGGPLLPAYSGQSPSFGPAGGGRRPGGRGPPASASASTYGWAGHGGWGSHPLVLRTSQLLDMLLQLFERTAGASFSGNPHEYNALCTLASVRLGSNLRVVFLRQLITWRMSGLL